MDTGPRRRTAQAPRRTGTRTGGRRGGGEGLWRGLQETRLPSLAPPQPAEARGSCSARGHHAGAWPGPPRGRTSCGCRRHCEHRPGRPVKWGSDRLKTQRAREKEAGMWQVLVTQKTACTLGCQERAYICLGWGWCSRVPQAALKGGGCPAPSGHHSHPRARRLSSLGSRLGSRHKPRCCTRQWPDNGHRRQHWPRRWSQPRALATQHPPPWLMNRASGAPAPRRLTAVPGSSWLRGRSQTALASACSATTSRCQEDQGQATAEEGGDRSLTHTSVQVGLKGVTADSLCH